MKRGAGGGGLQTQWNDQGMLHPLQSHHTRRLSTIPRKSGWLGSVDFQSKGGGGSIEPLGQTPPPKKKAQLIGDPKTNLRPSVVSMKRGGEVGGREAAEVCGGGADPRGQGVQEDGGGGVTYLRFG